MPAVQETVEQVRRIEVDRYKYGFETLIESGKAPRGLSEDVAVSDSLGRGGCLAQPLLKAQEFFT
jgi:hypothetical protein